jgi:hypothetical protein
VEYQRVERREGETGMARGGSNAQFLQELRQLRDLADLGQAELAARAHYPCEVIMAAETGPSLPELPVLSAYVRGCGRSAMEVAEWEDRWRSATGVAASPLLATRPPMGDSDAAAAGARIGATSAAADSHDPFMIMAALDRFATSMAKPSPQADRHIPEMRPSAGTAEVDSLQSAGPGFGAADLDISDTTAEVPGYGGAGVGGSGVGGGGVSPTAWAPTSESAAAAEAGWAPGSATPQASVPVPVPGNFAGATSRTGSRSRSLSGKTVLAVVVIAVILVILIAIFA